MLPAPTGRIFRDMPTLAPLRKRLGELASRNIFIDTSAWTYEAPWPAQLSSLHRLRFG